MLFSKSETEHKSDVVSAQSILVIRINFSNYKSVIEAGANILVSGSTIFKENQGDFGKNIEILSQKLQRKLIPKSLESA